MSAAQHAPSDSDIQVIADRMFMNYGHVHATELADAVAAHFPMDNETYWAIRPNVFAIAKATGSAS